MQPRNLLSLVPLATLAMALVANAAHGQTLPSPDIFTTSPPASLSYDLSWMEGNTSLPDRDSAVRQVDYQTAPELHDDWVDQKWANDAYASGGFCPVCDTCP